MTRRAYELWQKAGSPEGKDREFCRQAKREKKGFSSIFRN
jgi:hypothetical protein